jgi:hypothetical protein
MRVKSARIFLFSITCMRVKCIRTAAHKDYRTACRINTQIFTVYLCFISNWLWRKNIYHIKNIDFEHANVLNLHVCVLNLYVCVLNLHVCVLNWRAVWYGYNTAHIIDSTRLRVVVFLNGDTHVPGFFWQSYVNFIGIVLKSHVACINTTR